MNDKDTLISELRRSELYLSNKRVKDAVDEAIPRIEAAPDKGSLVEEIDTLRGEIEAVLSGKKRNLEKNDQEWIKDIVDREYGEASTTLSLILDSSKAERAPSKEKVKASILKQLKPEQIAELKKLREPVLLIVPDTNMERLVTAINKPECKNKGGISGQNDAYVDDFFKNAVFGTAQHFGVLRDQDITKFRFVIVEGAQHFDGTDSLDPWNKKQKMKNGKRIDDFDAYYQAKGLQSLNAPSYMMLMMRTLRKGKPTDHISGNNNQFTLLPGEPRDKHLHDGRVAYGYWDAGKARFHNAFLVAESAGARLRASVMGEVET